MYILQYWLLTVSDTFHKNLDMLYLKLDRHYDIMKNAIQKIKLILVIFIWHKLYDLNIWKII